MSGPTYEVWTHDGSRPELLSGGHPDKGTCRRAWRLSTHAAIVAAGVVLEVKGTCGGKQAKAIASAAAEAFRSTTGQAPEMAPRGVPGGDGKRPAESSNPALRAPDAAPEPMPAKYVPAPVEVTPAVERAALPDAATPFDEEPAPVVVVTRKPAPVAPEKPMPSTTGRCPCGAPSAPTAESRPGGRPTRPEFADLCAGHRSSAVGRRARTGEAPDAVRAWVLSSFGVRPAPKPRNAKPAAKAASATKPPKPRAVEAPVSDLLALVRRQREAIEALGGIDQAEALAVTVARVGGPAALVALVDELARTVA